MINFADEVTVLELANSRMSAYQQEARQSLIVKQLKSRPEYLVSLRNAAGTRMIELGQQILNGEPSQPSPRMPHRSAG